MRMRKSGIIKVSIKTKPMFEALENRESLVEGEIYTLVVRCMRSG